MRIQLFQPQAIHELGDRTNQEDSIYPLKGKATDQNRVFVVCDGMGGMDKGEVASVTVCDAIGSICESLYDPRKPFTDENFQHALQQAYNALDAADVRREGTMGTTMTFICFHSGGCLVAHIGDSRIYHLRPSLGYPEGVRFRSCDHSLVQKLYDLGEISYNDMVTSSRKNIILKALQPYQEQRTKATYAHITDVKAGDYFYLCTDGMLEQMEDDELFNIVCNPDNTDEEKAQQLIELTKNNADNHSGYLIRVKGVLLNPPADSLLLSDEQELRAKNKALNDTRKNEVWIYDDSLASHEEQAMQKPAGSASSSQPKTTHKKAKKGFNKLLLLIPVVFVLFIIVGVVGLFVALRHLDFGSSEPDIEVTELRNLSPTEALDALSGLHLSLSEIQEIEKNVVHMGIVADEELLNRRLIALKHLYSNEFLRDNHTVQNLRNVYLLYSTNFSESQQNVFKWFFALPPRQQKQWEYVQGNVQNFNDFRHRVEAEINRSSGD